VLLDDLLVDYIAQPVADWWSDLTGMNNYRLASTLMIGSAVAWAAATITVAQSRDASGVGIFLGVSVAWMLWKSSRRIERDAERVERAEGAFVLPSPARENARFERMLILFCCLLFIDFNGAQFVSGSRSGLSAATLDSAWIMETMALFLNACRPRPRLRRTASFSLFALGGAA
jgi:hypothetical protein